MTQPLVVSFGAGVNSTAMLLEMKNRGIRPDCILFADTGGEKPETLEHLERMNRWCKQVGFPEITVVRYEPKRAPYRTLEGNCLANETLPSLAFGMKSCSIKWKVTPQHKYLKSWSQGNTSYRKITIAIGLDAGRADLRRTYGGARPNSHLYEYWYPLQEWGFDRQACADLIRHEGLEVPPKSSCFFCPAMKKREILELREKHPNLFQRALRLERQALTGKHKLRSTKGLGRNFAWSDLEKQLDLWSSTTPERRSGSEPQIWHAPL